MSDGAAIKYRGKGKKTIAKENALREEMEATPLTHRPPELVDFKCKCTKSRCLKMYCECFTSGYFCGPHCNCTGCSNTEENQQEVREARVFIKKRNPNAFKRKVEALEVIEAQQPRVPNLSSKQIPVAIQTMGCHCQKSSCLKGYCECYNMGLMCIPGKCRCIDCLNHRGRHSIGKPSYKQ